MNYVLLILGIGLSSITYSQGECMKVYESHHFVLNSTSDTVMIWVNNRDQNNFPTKGPNKFKIVPGNRIEISELAWAEEFRDPTQWYVSLVIPEGLTRLCDSKNWSFEKLSETQGEYTLILLPTDEGGCQMDKNSMYSNEAIPLAPDEPEPLEQEEEIYDFANPEAEFPGGPTALRTWILENMEYPERAPKDSIRRKVYIQFVVEKTGDLSTIKVLRSPNVFLSNEAIRLIMNMPNWEPGKLNGKAIRMRYNLPIVF